MTRLGSTHYTSSIPLDLNGSCLLEFVKCDQSFLKFYCEFLKVKFFNFLIAMKHT